MDLEEYRKDFLGQVAVWASADMNFHHSAFVEYSAHLLEDSEEVFDFQPCYYRGTGARNRAIAVDGYAFDEADGSIRLFVAEPIVGENGGMPTLTQTQARSLFGRLQAFFEDAADGRVTRVTEESSPGYGLAMNIHEQLSSFTRLRFYLLTDAVLSSRIRDWPEADIKDIPTEFHIWDISRFHRVFISKSGRDDLIINFEEFLEGGLPCLAASMNTEQYQAYLSAIPGSILASIYDTFGSRLLEGNVRSFLSTRGRINKGIRNTILNEPHMFFAYNNGIAATCSDAVIEDGPGGLHVLQATDFQIVNGGQTTASLAAARRRDRAQLDCTLVPMKLSIISPEASGQIIPLISRYANSQNKVSDADFFSNHEFHRRIEQFSRRLGAPARSGLQHETHWFYERTRGQYQNSYAAMSPAEIKRFQAMNPREQVFTKTDLAKYENAWRKLPHIVSRGAQKNFMTFASYISLEWEKSNEAINEDYFKRAVGRAILFRRTEKLVSSQPWYLGGYRAQIVAFTIAKLVSSIETKARGKVLDFRSIWQRQSISQPVEEQIVLLARSVFEIIVNSPAGIQNVTEWCKKELCWQRAEDLNVAILPEFYSELVDEEEDRMVRRAGRTLQVIDSGIEAQAQVVNLGADYWLQLRSWGLGQRLISPEEDRLMDIAANLPNRIPTEYQSAKLLKINKRLELEGFKYNEPS